MTPVDVTSAVTVSFSCGEFNALQHCSQCGRHAWCHGDETDELICELCFRTNGDSFRPSCRRSCGSSMTEQLLEVAREHGSSVKLTTNSKGDIQIEVKVYVPDTAEDVVAAQTLAEATFNSLRGKYPRA